MAEYAYTSKAPLSSLVSELIGADAMSLHDVGTDPADGDRESCVHRVLEVLATWPLVHEDVITSTERLILFARQVQAAKAGAMKSGHDVGKDLHAALLNYTLNEVRNGFQDLNWIMRTNGGTTYQAYIEAMTHFDTALASGIGQRAVPDRSFKSGRSGQPANFKMCQRSHEVIVVHPKPEQWSAFSVCEILIPGSERDALDAGIRAYAWDPATSRSMFDDWDSVDSALVTCFQRFWETGPDRRTQLRKAVSDLTGHNALLKPVLYLDAIAVADHLKGRDLGLDLVRAAVQTWATPETLVFSVMHPAVASGSTRGVRTKVEGYAAPLGFRKLDVAIYLQTAAATREILASEPILAAKRKE